MFFDRAKIFIQAGNGGDGCTSFYTEKHLPLGGPDGGDGGKGGDIVFVADPNTNNLIDFQYTSRFKAESGSRGERRFSQGKRGKNLIIKVPCGTIIRDKETNNIISDMTKANEEITVLVGGNGGKGNSRFKSSRRKSPHFHQSGQKTVERCVTLELKVIADIGLLGFPNVGKSTLLSVISAARPKVANYHFTTLSPCLGVVQYYDNSFVVADIPGIIEGASDGQGLGLEFLRHIERTRLLVHMVDISGREGRDPVDDYFIVRQELKKYSKELSKRKQIVVLTMSDLVTDLDSAVDRFRQATKTRPLVVNAIINEGVDKLVKTMFTKLSKLPLAQGLQYTPYAYPDRDTTSFEIFRDDDGSFVLEGGMIDELARNVVLDNVDSFRYFQKKLNELGIIKSLVKAGAKEGDTVQILDVAFDFVE